MRDKTRQDRDSRGRFIPWVITSLLGITVIKYFIVISIISGDPSLAVENDYSHRALAWDEENAARTSSGNLGWTSALSLKSNPTSPGDSVFGLTLKDERGEPIAGARVQLSIFHRARASEIHEASAVTDASGQFTVSVPRSRRGLWEVRLDATRGADRFLENRTIVWGEGAR